LCERNGSAVVEETICLLAFLEDTFSKGTLFWRRH